MSTGQAHQKILSLRERQHACIAKNNQYELRQCQELDEWLQTKYEVLGEEPPLNVELSDHEFQQMCTMMKQNKEMDRLANLRIEECQQLKFEYESEGARLQSILEFVGLPAHVLSNAGKASLKNLTDLACVLKTKNIYESTFVVALSQLKEEIERTKQDIVDKEKGVDNLNRKLNTYEENLQNINTFYQKKNESAHVNIPLLQKRQKETYSMQQKCVQYLNQMDEIKDQDETIQKYKKFHHDTLLQLHQTLMEIKEELYPLEQKYKRYKTLPPDINLAKVKVEETKRQLMQLEQKLQCDIDALAL